MGQVEPAGRRPTRSQPIDLLLIGTIDVKKLEALALLDVVRRVDPAG
ncbi:MAG: hypothetical protein ACYTG0_04210 [Planctomycetota bacterium]